MANETIALILERLKRHAALFFAVGLVGVAMSGLLIGFEPIGEDPDRLYRPLKSELAASLREGRLPFWSYRMGLGLPLIAESHVAAFYPPNLLFYRIFDVPTAYRLLMWLHCVGLAATTYGYARTLNITEWGSALAAVTFTLCGFQAVHSIHEPFYSLMPYLPLALAIAERYMATGRPVWVAALAITLGVQWTLGHFQLQMWTSGLVLLTALWRTAGDRHLWKRGLALAIGVLWGMAIAAVQLHASWRLAQFVGQTHRKIGLLLFYSYPPEHWFEAAIPQALQALRFRTEGPYWESLETTGFEARFYVGTIPLILAFVGWFAKANRVGTMPWRLLIPLGLALATMPRWWADGYEHFVSLPGLSLFRGPARYTLLPSLGLSLLAGQGLQRLVSRKRFQIGLTSSLLVAGAAVAGIALWSSGSAAREQIVPHTLMQTLFSAGVAWIVAVAVVLGWRSARFGPWAPVLATVIELALLYYTGTTKWGPHMSIPGDSPVMQMIASDPKARLVSGLLENLPLSVGKGTAHPYIGFAHAYPNVVLMALQDRILGPGLSQGDNAARDREIAKNWFRRCGVTHLLLDRREKIGLGKETGVYRDQALDRIVQHWWDKPATRTWHLFQLDQPFPEARIVKRARTVNHPRLLNDLLSRSDDPELGFFLKADRVPERADVENARVVSWDGTSAVVEHDGTCDLVLARTFDPDWTARIDDGPEQMVLPIDGGFPSVRVPGAGVHRVTFRYTPRHFWVTALISLSAATLALAIIGVTAANFIRSRTRQAHGLS